MSYDPSKDRPRRLPQGTPADEAAKIYEERGRIALENEKWNHSDIYFEWARVERQDFERGIKNTLDRIAAIYREEGTRQPYPADSQSLKKLSRMKPQRAGIQSALLSDCVSYDQGEPLFYHVFKTGPVLFVKLSTRAEFTQP